MVAGNTAGRLAALSGPRPSLKGAKKILTPPPPRGIRRFKDKNMSCLQKNDLLRKTFVPLRLKILTRALDSLTFMLTLLDKGPFITLKPPPIPPLPLSRLSIHTHGSFDTYSERAEQHDVTNCRVFLY